MRPLVLVALAGCSTESAFVEPEPGLERMLAQPRYDDFEASDFFADHRVMQLPPDGVVSTSRVLGNPDLTSGYSAGAYARQIPLPLTHALLARGHDRFEIFCAPCHGILGDGTSVVAADMSLVKPRSLVALPVRGYPPGRIYRVINEGFGLMPTYAAQLPLEDRWAVVAYVQALQLSQSVALDHLPEPLQREARSVLR